MTQRDKMRELFRLHQGDKAVVIRAYAEAEKAGEVDRVHNASGYGTEQYARALWSDGEKKGWLDQAKASSSGREKPVAHFTPDSAVRASLPISPIALSATEVKGRPTSDAFVAHLAAVKGNLQTLKNAQDEVENTIAQMEQWIGMAVTNQPKLVESYINTVREWLPEWDRLEEASQAFLPQAELLFESFSDSNYPDFSLFIHNYCKALENEFLNKLLSVYTDDLRSRHGDNLDAFLLMPSQMTKPKHSPRS